jgi:hypothetical protein
VLNYALDGVVDARSVLVDPAMPDRKLAVEGETPATQVA